MDLWLSWCPYFVVLSQWHVLCPSECTCWPCNFCYRIISWNLKLQNMPLRTITGNKKQVKLLLCLSSVFQLISCLWYCIILNGYGVGWLFYLPFLYLSCSFIHFVCLCKKYFFGINRTESKSRMYAFLTFYNSCFTKDFHAEKFLKSFSRLLEEWDVNF